ncbi:MAG: DEAD/DEAH box helicase [Clostridia bacterium]|nr:DEAD/DEAH box helicase [Clostridia bacterium]
MKTFENLNIAPNLVATVEALGYLEPTEIQAKAIPELLKGHDLVGLSQTGTGKTLAFLLPIISKITDERYPQALILCPTRELAEQILLEAKKLSPKSNVKAIAIFGGTDIQRQIYAIKRGVNLVIGTPGRILDHIRRKTLKLGLINTVVLDEADEMLNMGFLPDIQSILSVVPTERQTIMFSATMSKDISSIATRFMRSPVRITVGTPNATIASIKQTYFICPKDKKKRTLNALLREIPRGRTIVFCNTKKMVDSVELYLKKSGFMVLALHGDMPQNVRRRVMNEYKTEINNILVTTDIAARGIDVADILSVINFDLPQNNEYYIHRVGRTGRAGKSGSAYTLLNSPEQVAEIKEIEKKTKSHITPSTLSLEGTLDSAPTRSKPVGKKLNLKSREKRALAFGKEKRQRAGVKIVGHSKIGTKKRTIRNPHKSKIHF